MDDDYEPQERGPQPGDRCTYKRLNEDILLVQHWAPCELAGLFTDASTGKRVYL